MGIVGYSEVGPHTEGEIWAFVPLARRFCRDPSDNEISLMTMAVVGPNQRFDSIGKAAAASLNWSAIAQAKRHLDLYAGTAGVMGILDTRGWRHAGLPSKRPWDFAHGPAIRAATDGLRPSMDTMSRMAARQVDRQKTLDLFGAAVGRRQPRLLDPTGLLKVAGSFDRKPLLGMTALDKRSPWSLSGVNTRELRMLSAGIDKTALMKLSGVLAQPSILRMSVAIDKQKAWSAALGFDHRHLQMLTAGIRPGADLGLLLGGAAGLDRRQLHMLSAGFDRASLLGMAGLSRSQFQTLSVGMGRGFDRASLLGLTAALEKQRAWSLGGRYDLAKMAGAYAKAVRAQMVIAEPGDLAAEIGLTQADESLWDWLPEAPSLEEVRHYHATASYLAWAAVTLMLITGQVPPAVLAAAGFLDRSIAFAVHLAQRRQDRN
jgi:hypothetical protein